MTKTFWRFVINIKYSSSGYWTVTQANGTVYGPLFSLGWIQEPSRLVPVGKKPFYALQMVIGPIAIAIGWVSK